MLPKRGAPFRDSASVCVRHKRQFVSHQRWERASLWPSFAREMTMLDDSSHESSLFRDFFSCLSLSQSACLTPLPRVRRPRRRALPRRTPPFRVLAHCLGGRSVAYNWKNVTILGGGFVTGNVFSQAERGLVYARTDVGGAYRFSSRDKAWVPLTDHFSRADANYVGTESIAPDPSDANVVYAAVGTSTASCPATAP